MIKYITTLIILSLSQLAIASDENELRLYHKVEGVWQQSIVTFDANTMCYSAALVHLRDIYDAKAAKKNANYFKQFVYWYDCFVGGRKDNVEPRRIVLTPVDNDNNECLYITYHLIDQGDGTLPGFRSNYHYKDHCKNGFDVIAKKASGNQKRMLE